MLPVVTEKEYMGAGSMDFRRPLLIALMVFVTTFVTWHTIAEFIFGIRVLAFLEGAFAVYSVIILYLVIRNPYSIYLALLIVVPGLLLILVAMAHPNTPPNVFIWAFLMPVVTYSLMGLKLGFSLTLGGTVLSLLTYLHKYGGTEERVNFLTLSDGVICVSMIWIVMHLYERYREKSIDALQRLATTDELTGLQNRRQMEKAFMHLSVAADRQHQALAIVVMDLDHFKQINDRWGHEAGDAVLVHVAELLRNNLRRSDWAFRTGGEEFCLLLPVVGPEGAIKAAETVLIKIANEPVQYGDFTIPLTASIGVAVYPEEGISFDKLLQRADEYMYCAKQKGRNRVVGAEIKGCGDK